MASISVGIGESGASGVALSLLSRRLQFKKPDSARTVECLPKWGSFTRTPRSSLALATHRDFWDGKQFVCGHNPGVPADDTVIVARVTDDAGQMLASLMNHACHPTTLAWENTLVGDTAVADRNGRELGYAALPALTALPAAGTTFVYAGPVVSVATLGSWKHQSIDLAEKATWKLQRWHEPLRYRPGQPTIEQTQAELDQFQADEATARSAGDETHAAHLRALAERKNRLLHRLHQLPPGEIYPLQVVLWHLGDAIWLGVQGESYSLLQTELRRRFPDKIILIATIAADWGASYLPPRELYDAGIYQETIAVVAAGSLEQLIEATAHRIHTPLS